MSLEAVSAAWATGLKTAPKMVLVALSWQANDWGYAFVRVWYIAQRCGMSERNVFRHITNLEDLGYITIKPRPRRSSIYYVHVSELGEPLITPERVSPDKLSGLGRISYAERIAAENIAEQLEKRMSAKEARRRALKSAGKTRDADGRDDRSREHDKLSGLGKSCAQPGGKPGDEDANSDKLAGQPDRLSPVALTGCHTESSSENLPSTNSVTEERNRDSIEEDLEARRVEQLEKIEQRMKVGSA